MNRKWVRAAAMAVSILVVLPLVAGAIGIAHECSDENCLICVALRNTASAMRFCLTATAAVFFVFTGIVRCAAKKTAFMTVRTPVLSHVRLND